MSQTMLIDGIEIMEQQTPMTRSGTKRRSDDEGLDPMVEDTRLIKRQLRRPRASLTAFTSDTATSLEEQSVPFSKRKWKAERLQENVSLNSGALDPIMTYPLNTDVETSYPTNPFGSHQFESAPILQPNNAQESEVDPWEVSRWDPFKMSGKVTPEKYHAERGLDTSQSLDDSPIGPPDQDKFSEWYDDVWPATDTPADTFDWEDRLDLPKPTWTPHDFDSLLKNLEMRKQGSFMVESGWPGQDALSRDRSDQFTSTGADHPFRPLTLLSELGIGRDNLDVADTSDPIDGKAIKSDETGANTSSSGEAPITQLPINTMDDDAHSESSGSSTIRPGTTGALSRTINDPLFVAEEADSESSDTPTVIFDGPSFGMKSLIQDKTDLVTESTDIEEDHLQDGKILRAEFPEEGKVMDNDSICRWLGLQSSHDAVVEESREENEEMKKLLDGFGTFNLQNDFLSLGGQFD